MPKKPSKDKSSPWDNLTPKEKEFLTAFRNSTPERQEIAERILKLFYDGKDQEAHTLLADTFARDFTN